MARRGPTDLSEGFRQIINARQAPEGDAAAPPPTYAPAVPAYASAPPPPPAAPVMADGGVYSLPPDAAIAALPHQAPPPARKPRWLVPVLCLIVAGLVVGILVLALKPFKKGNADPKNDDDTKHTVEPSLPNTGDVDVDRHIMYARQKLNITDPKEALEWAVSMVDQRRAEMGGDTASAGGDSDDGEDLPPAERPEALIDGTNSKDGLMAALGERRSRVDDFEAELAAVTVPADTTAFDFGSDGDDGITRATRPQAEDRKKDAAVPSAAISLDALSAQTPSVPGFAPLD